MKKKSIIELLVLFVLGCLTSVSLPPVNLFIINFFTFSILFSFLFKKLDIQKNKITYFLYGWLFGFGYFLSNLYWITISLTFDANFSFLIPLALIFIPSFLGIFYGLITLLFKLINPKNILSAFFIFSLLFGFIEYIRGIALTGFPWNLIVFSFSENLNFLNILSLIGTYSLNLIVISFFILPSIFILRKTKKEIFVCIIFILIPILFFSYSNFQKIKFNSKDFVQIPYTLRILGTNISLDRFYDNSQTEKVISELILISSPDKSKKILFLWPEGIIPNIYRDDMILYKEIFNKSFNQDHLIGLGITHREAENQDYKYYNSFSIFNNDLDLINNYNKNNLVPFGEFLPFENLLNKIGLKTITNNFGSFNRGLDRKIIEIKNNNKVMNFLPLICYEIIYSGNLTKNYDFDFILNISEDGWFGKSVGPKQHFVHSIFRAIETGKYVVRSSNNGMTAIINPLGEIEKKIDYGETGFIDLEFIKKNEKTFFSTYGNKIFILLILIYIFMYFSFNRPNYE